MNKETLTLLLAYIDAKVESAIAHHECSSHDPEESARDEDRKAAMARLALFESIGVIESFPYSGMTYDPATRTGQVIERGEVVCEQRI